ncbi:hypothetical protein [Endozoicomonas euniceicola]|uniref:Uncharacterized protein n=1 Tax=Endozoicomonas euniceicola TaxID=1234143 RepID=A0ABY6H199_9GAMM|nr:hypothetical protein [Endozoicomonas euniceicola]UYM18369.1 hypothetical protein NX720_10820 [Endozoicomonas euniceicola]
MPIASEPPFTRPPYSSDTDHLPPGGHTDERVRKTAEPSGLSAAGGEAGKHTPLRARNIRPVAASPTVNARAVAKANYIQQLRKTTVLQAQASLVNHIPALKRLGGDPAGIPANLGFSISYNDKGTLISVVPPDERLRANPQKYNEIKTRLIRKLEQIENQYKGTKKQDLFNKTATAEEQLRISKEALSETGASMPVVDYRQFMIPLGSMVSRPAPPSNPGAGAAAAARPGEFMLERERRRHGAPVPTGSGASGGFKLDQSDVDRVRFISAGESNLLETPSSTSSHRLLKQAYFGFRSADADWLENSHIAFQSSEPTTFERIAYSNSNHQVLKKFKVQLQPKSSRDYVPGDEILVVKDMSTNQLKLVRAGSFDGEDAGGGGFPGYSIKGAERALAYLKSKVVGNHKPYQHLHAGNLGNIAEWTCGFNSLQVAIFMATGIKVPFPVLVAVIEDKIDEMPAAAQQRIRNELLRKRYSFDPTLLQILLGDTDRYKKPPFREAYEGYVLIGTEQGSPTARGFGHNYNRCDSKVLTRNEIENHDFDKASSVIVAQDLYAYAIYRVKIGSGSHRFVVYDPHNFHFETDFFTNPSKAGLKMFNSKQEAFHYLSTRKNGHERNRGKFDGFYRFPDIILQDLQKNMLKTKSNWEKRVIG